jgi:hypothetical protein
MRKTKTTKITTRPIITGSPRVVLVRMDILSWLRVIRLGGLQNRFSNSTWAQKILVIGESREVIDGLGGGPESGRARRCGEVDGNHAAPQYLRRFALSVAPFSPNVSVSYQ